MKEIAGQFIIWEGLDIVTTFIGLWCLSGYGFYEGNTLISSDSFGVLLVRKLILVVIGIHILEMNDLNKRFIAGMIAFLALIVFWNIGQLYLEVLVRILR